MNVYTVTYLNKNYGSILQAYALQSRLKEYGANPIVLQRVIRRRFPRLHILRQLIRPEKNYSFFQRVMRWRDSKKYAGKNAKLGKFINERIATNQITDIASFVQDVSSADIFLAGSDQIWSMLNGPLSPWYSLQWVKKDHRKFSYAASLGQSDLGKEQVEAYSVGLSDFQVISLREYQALERLQSVFPGRIRQDVDPTLLYDGVFWHKLSSPRLVKEPYVFVYMLRPDEKVIELAKKIASEKGCRVVYTGLYAFKFSGVTTVCDAGAEDFLSYIEHADAVITNSFHGTAFSIMFERPFLSVKITSTSSRVENLLNMTGLMSQYVTDVSKTYPLDVDFTEARESLKKEREKSCAYIQSICQPCR